MESNERKRLDLAEPNHAPPTEIPDKQTPGTSTTYAGGMDCEVAKQALTSSLTNHPESVKTDQNNNEESTEAHSSSESSCSDESNDGWEAWDRPKYIAGIPVPIIHLDPSEEYPFDITEQILPLKMAARAKYDQMREDLGKLYQKLVKRHESCTIDGEDKCSLQRNLEALDAQWGVATETSEHQETTDAISQVVQFVAEEVSRREPALQCRVIPMGSSFSRLKVGRLDEFDFMLELTHITCGQEGTEVLADADDLHQEDDDDSIADSDDEVSGFEGCHRILVSSPQQLTRFQGYLDTSGTEHFFSGAKIKSKFETLVSDVLAEIGESLRSRKVGDGIQTYVAESISHLLKPTVSDGPLCMRLQTCAHPVKVDITPCIKWEEREGAVAYLVPSASCNTWLTANKLPLDLEPRIKQAVRVSKIIRDMCQLVEGERATSEHSGLVYLVLKKPRKQYQLVEAITEEIMTGHYYGQFGLLHSALVSYALLGTLMKQFQADIPLCRLVGSAFGKYENIDPKGKNLLETQHDRNHSDAKRLAAVKLLKKLEKEDADTDAFIRTHTPLWYFANPPSLKDLLGLSQKTPIESFSVGVKTDGTLSSPKRDCLEVNVYPIGVEDMRYALTKLHYVPEEEDDDIDEDDEDEEDEEEEEGSDGECEGWGVEHELSQIGGDPLYIVVVPDRGLFEMQDMGVRRFAADLAQLDLPEFVQTLVHNNWSLRPAGVLNV